VAGGLLRTDRGNPWFADLARTSVRFLTEATDPGSGLMRNFRGFDGSWLDVPHAGDHVGRAIWGLCELLATDEDSVPAGTRKLLEVLAAAPPSAHARSVAFSLLGWSRAHECQPDGAFGRQVDDLVDMLVERLHANAGEDWYWFEDTLTYDNARLPQSLVAACRTRPRPAVLTAALRALDWYCAQCRVDEPAVVLVGNHWRTRADLEEGAADEGDEQPLDAAALVEACAEAYRTTGRPIYRERAVRALGWFHGRNRWGLPVVDREGCHDGIGPAGVNGNQGAESTLAYLQARLALSAAGIDHHPVA
jgi:hypothetical protein